MKLKKVISSLVIVGLITGGIETSVFKGQIQNNTVLKENLAPESQLMNLNLSGNSLPLSSPQFSIFRVSLLSFLLIGLPAFLLGCGPAQQPSAILPNKPQVPPTNIPPIPPVNPPQIPPTNMLPVSPNNPQLVPPNPPTVPGLLVPILIGNAPFQNGSHFSDGTRTLLFEAQSLAGASHIVARRKDILTNSNGFSTNEEFPQLFIEIARMRDVGGGVKEVDVNLDLNLVVNHYGYPVPFYELSFMTFRDGQTSNPTPWVTVENFNVSGTSNPNPISQTPVLFSALTQIQEPYKVDLTFDLSNVNLSPDTEVVVYTHLLVDHRRQEFRVSIGQLRQNQNQFTIDLISGNRFSSLYMDIGFAQPGESPQNMISERLLTVQVHSMGLPLLFFMSPLAEMNWSWGSLTEGLLFVAAGLFILFLVKKWENIKDFGQNLSKSKISAFIVILGILGFVASLLSTPPPSPQENIEIEEVQQDNPIIAIFSEHNTQADLEKMKPYLDQAFNQARESQRRIVFVNEVGGIDTRLVVLRFPNRFQNVTQQEIFGDNPNQEKRELFIQSYIEILEEEIERSNAANRLRMSPHPFYRGLNNYLNRPDNAERIMSITDQWELLEQIAQNDPQLFQQSLRSLAEIHIKMMQGLYKRGLGYRHLLMGNVENGIQIYREGMDLILNATHIRDSLFSDSLLWLRENYPNAQIVFFRGLNHGASGIISNRLGENNLNSFQTIPNDEAELIELLTRENQGREELEGEIHRAILEYAAQRFVLPYIIERENYSNEEKWEQFDTLLQHLDDAGLQELIETMPLWRQRFGPIPAPVHREQIREWFFNRVPNIEQAWESLLIGFELRFPLHNMVETAL